MSVTHYLVPDFNWIWFGLFSSFAAANVRLSVADTPKSVNNPKQSDRRRDQVIHTLTVC